MASETGVCSAPQIPRLQLLTGKLLLYCCLMTQYYVTFVVMVYRELFREPNSSPHEVSRKPP